jgi:hypothetical protein
MTPAPRCGAWCLTINGEVLLEASENVWGDLIDKMSDPELLQAMQPLDIDEQVYLLQHLPRKPDRTAAGDPACREACPYSPDYALRRQQRRVDHGV